MRLLVVQPVRPGAKRPSISYPNFLVVAPFREFEFVEIVWSSIRYKNHLQLLLELPKIIRWNFFSFWYSPIYMVAYIFVGSSSGYSIIILRIILGLFSWYLFFRWSSGCLTTFVCFLQRFMQQINSTNKNVFLYKSWRIFEFMNSRTKSSFTTIYSNYIGYCLCWKRSSDD